MVSIIRLISISFIILIQLGGYSQSNNQTAKVAVLGTLFKQFVDAKQCTYVAMLADMSYRNISTSLGPMPSSVDYSKTVYDDSISVNAFSKTIKLTDCSSFYIKTFQQEKFSSRTNFLLSEKFSHNLSAINKRKVYIEVGKPLSGWEMLELFRNEQLYPNSELMRYQDSSFLVPVFIYEINGDKETSQTWIFKFKTGCKNGEVNLSLEDKFVL